MRSLIIGLLLSLPLIAVKAQGYNIQQSKNLPYIKGCYLGELISADDSGYYVSFYGYKNKIATTLIRKYDQAFNQVWTNDYAPSGYFFGFTSTKDYIFRVGAELIDKKNISYFIQPINKEGKAFKHKSIASHKFKDLNKIPYVESFSSPDTTKMAFLVIRDNNDSENKFHFSVTVYDKFMNLQFLRKFNFKQTENQIDILSASINNNGSVFVLTKELSITEPKEKYQYKIYVIAQADKQVKQIEIKQAGKHFNFLKLNSLANNNTALTAIYNLKADSKKPHGYIHMQLNAEGEIIEETKQIFPKRILKDFSQQKCITTISDQALTKEGHLIMTLEDNYYVKATNTNIAGFNQGGLDHVSRNIFVLTISEKGKLLNLSKIPKFQVNNENKFNSHKIVGLEGSDTYIFYNDKKINLDNELDANPEMLLPIDKSNLVSAKVNSDFDIKRVALLSEKKTSTCLIPNSIIRASKKRIAFLAAPEKLDLNSFNLGTIEIQ